LISSFEKIIEKLNESIILPYAIGNEFTLADILIFPWVFRWASV